MKYKVFIKGTQIRVKCKLAYSQSFDENELNIFTQKFIRGLMRPKVVGKRKIEYIASGNCNLLTFIQGGLSKDEFFLVFAQFLECIKKLERNSFDFNNLVTDLEYIFYNQTTKEVHFLYQPIDGIISSNNIFTFFYSLINNTVLDQSEDTSFIDELTSFLQSINGFSSGAVEKYILKVYPQVYKQVKRSKPGDSQILQQTGRAYFENKYKSEYQSGHLQDNEEYDEATGLLEDDYDDATGLLNDEFEEATGLLIEDDEATGLLQEQEEENTTLLVDVDYEESTTVLEDNEGTTVLPQTKPHYPFLLRLNTYERIEINKPVFRIGKEKSYVDYFIMSNNAVSRIHADIITRNNRYFLKDNNSTNHTFVNGTMIPMNEETELFDRDAIMFANEPFEFLIS